MINRNNLFKRLYAAGETAQGDLIIVKTQRNRFPKNRIGITTSKAVGNSPQRNRARRVTKEAYRLLEDKVRTGNDIVFICRTKAVFVKMDAVKKEMERQFKKLGLWAEL